MKEITRNDIEVAIQNHLLKGGKIKKLSPQRTKNLLWGMRIKTYRNPSELADKAIDKVSRILDEKEVELYEEEERHDLEFAEYYEEN